MLVKNCGKDIWLRENQKRKRDQEKYMAKRKPKEKKSKGDIQISTRGVRAVPATNE